MKTTIKIIVIATVLTIAIMVGCACAMPAVAEERPKDFVEVARCLYLIK